MTFDRTNYNRKWNAANPHKRKAQSKRYYAKNHEEIYRRQMERHKIHPLRQAIYAARYNAQRRGIAFSLTAADIEALKLNLPVTCPLLGIKMDYQRYGKRKRTPNSASLDRIDSTKGYVSDNVRVISWRANDLKRNATLEELKLIVKNWRTS